jgi:Sec-independent protein translocase protein TatA
MGFGTGLLLLVVVGFLVLGPKRMQDMLRQAARAKAELDRSTREIRTHLVAEIEGGTSRRN